MLPWLRDNRPVTSGRPDSETRLQRESDECESTVEARATQRKQRLSTSVTITMLLSTDVRSIFNFLLLLLRLPYFCVSFDESSVHDLSLVNHNNE
jgi:hypothetical protein